MEDHLKFCGKWKTASIIFTSIFRKMEDDLNTLKMKDDLNEKNNATKTIRIKTMVVAPLNVT
jgi:hypothetical protein